MKLAELKSNSKLDFFLRVLMVLIILYSSVIIYYQVAYYLYPLDIRNRVVGSRLVHEHIQPYFYIWKPGNPERFYEVRNSVDNFLPGREKYPSDITSTPVYHWLFYPIARLHQDVINWIMVVAIILSYIFWVVVSGYRLSNRERTMQLCLFIPFLLTACWLDLFVSLNNYFVFVDFFLISYLFLKNRKYAIAGIVFFVYILIKPNILLFLIPIALFNFKTNKRFFWITGLLLTAYITFVFCDAYYLTSYKEFFRNANMYYDFTHSKQYVLPSKMHYRPIENMPTTWRDINRDSIMGKFTCQRVFGNLSYFLYVRLKHYPSMYLLQLIFKCALALYLLLIAFLKFKKVKLDFFQTSLLGLLIFYFSEFSSPYSAPFYYGVEFLILGIVYAYNLKRVNKIAFFAYLFVFVPVIMPMQLTFLPLEWFCMPWFCIFCSIILQLIDGRIFHFTKLKLN